MAYPGGINKRGLVGGMKIRKGSRLLLFLVNKVSYKFGSLFFIH
jgi:hypothetical protein